MCGTQQRDLLVLVALALSAVQSAPTQEGACQVWLGLGLGLGVRVWRAGCGRAMANPNPNPNPNPTLPRCGRATATSTTMAGCTGR